MAPSEHLLQPAALDAQLPQQVRDDARLPRHFRGAVALGAYWGVSEWCVYRLVRLGLPAVRVGRRNYLFNRRQVDAWLEAHQVNGSVFHSPDCRRRVQ